jgi:hypothetical protein
MKEMSDAFHPTAVARRSHTVHYPHWYVQSFLSNDRLNTPGRQVNCSGGWLLPITF